MSKSNTKDILAQNALDLFSKRGYTHVSVDTIVKKSKASKGAFYHHFKSKEAVLDCLVDSYVSSVSSGIEEIVQQDMDAVKKLQKFIELFHDASSPQNQQAIRIGSVLLQIDSSVLLEKLQDRLKVAVVPYLLNIFEQGSAEKSMHISYPKEVGEFYIELIAMYKKKFMYLFEKVKKDPKKVSEIKKKMFFLEDLFNRIIGVEPGTIKFAKMKMEYIKHITG